MAPALARGFFPPRGGQWISPLSWGFSFSALTNHFGLGWGDGFRLRHGILMDLQLDEGDLQGYGLMREDGPSASRGEWEPNEGAMDEKG